MSIPSSSDTPALHDMQDLLNIMARLRDPQGGCPWDLKQDFSTIAPYTIEEAYEVADAISRNAMGELRDELGDLLFQAVFHARMAEEAGHFDFSDIVQAVCEKMIRRHPHVFGEADIATADAQTESWEKLKAEERADKGAVGVLDDVPTALPALLRAQKLQSRAARVGFDWPDMVPVIGKIREEIGELETEIEEGSGKHRLQDELGDVMFACVNLARKLGVDAETALRHTNDKFKHRFSYVETELEKQGTNPQESTLTEMDALWEQAKRNRQE